jgi:hypothetical protein
MGLVGLIVSCENVLWAVKNLFVSYVLQKSYKLFGLNNYETYNICWSPLTYLWNVSLFPPI